MTPSDRPFSHSPDFPSLVAVNSTFRQQRLQEGPREVHRICAHEKEEESEFSSYALTFPSFFSRGNGRWREGEFSAKVPAAAASAASVRAKVRVVEEYRPPPPPPPPLRNAWEKDTFAGFRPPLEKESQ